MKTPLAPRGLKLKTKIENQKGELKMENKNYVVAEVGFEGLFEAMVALAESDMKKDNEALANEAREGLAEWLTILRKLDIADAVIG